MYAYSLGDKIASGDLCTIQTGRVQNREVVVTIDEGQMKDLLNAALIELFEEQPNTFADIILETLEDVGLARAIREGRRNDFVDEDQIMAILDSQTSRANRDRKSNNLQSSPSFFHVRSV